MTVKKRLGKGLGALIPEHYEESSQAVKQIELEKIRPNPCQPRTKFSEEKIRELAASISEHGVIQPVVVTADGDGFTLIAGERRVRACREAGLTTVPAIVKALSSQEALEVALIENLQREDLNIMEEAGAYRILLREFAITQEELSNRLGKSRSAITNTLRLLYLDQRVQQDILSGKLTAGQARPLLALKEEKRQREMANKIMEKNLSAREVEKIVSRLVADSGTALKPGSVSSVPVNNKDLFWDELREKLQQHLGTKVRIRRKRRKEGAVEIDFYGESDLERVIQIILGEGPAY